MSGEKPAVRKVPCPTCGEPVIHGIERISRPGRRVYRNKQEIPRVLDGLGLAIVSTSKGVLSGTEAAKSGVGGEILCQVW